MENSSLVDQAAMKIMARTLNNYYVNFRYLSSKEGIKKDSIPGRFYIASARRALRMFSDLSEKYPVSEMEEVSGPLYRENMKRYPSELLSHRGAQCHA